MLKFYNKILFFLTFYRILPWWKDWTYRYGLCAVNSSWQAILWEDLYDMWVNNTDTKFLSCIHDMDIVTNFLRKTANVLMQSNPEDYILRLQAINNFLTIITKYIRIEHIRRHILSNFKILIPR